MTDIESANALLFKNRNEWRFWLEKNHMISDEVRLIHYKKSLGKKSLNHFDAVEEALCFGWIDSKLKKIDEEKFILKYTPRKSKSVWSKINKKNAEKMISLGKMTNAGFDKIEEAKKQGFWDTAYTNLVKERLPSDLKKALIVNKTTWNNFQNFANSYRNMYIGWIKNAKTKETRKKRISKVVKNSYDNIKPGIE
ncbi:MAG: YdeI/OmpD-associated family protein [Candidatus Thermoplasmatota archaeon]|nr:YdeI/OmpD-associated family protein [Candidatus Thermoplasmatota archaeon]